MRIDRIPTAGSLGDWDFPDLVEAVHEAEWTGQLVVTHMGVSKTVFVQDGSLVFASSTSRDDRLGELLLRQGRITLAQYVEAGRLVGAGKRLGTILVEHGSISPKELVRGVVEQTQEIIYGSFQWTEGRFRLEAGPIGSEAITLKLSTPAVILEGIRRIEAWSRIVRGIGGLEACYVAAEGAADRLSPLALAAEKAALVAGLDLPRGIDEICRQSALSHFEVCRTIWAFRLIGLVSRVDIAADAAEVDEGLSAVLTEGFLFTQDQE